MRIAILTMAVMALSVFANLITNGGEKNEAQAAFNDKFYVCKVNTLTGRKETKYVAERERKIISLGNPSSYKGECEEEVVNSIIPQLHCVYPEANGTYTAYFGYQNNNSSTVVIPHNLLTNGLYQNLIPINGPQPTSFDPGTSAGYPNSSFSVNFPSNKKVTRVVKGPDDNETKVIASNNSQVCPTACGDGRINEGEACDNGENNGVTCNAEYNSTCTYCSSECEEVEVRGPYCGDGAVDQGEECDGGSFCNENCTAIPSATVVAYKVVCDDEQYLPNMNGGADITATTAQNRVNQSNGHCTLVPGRSFQRGNESAGNGGDATYGDAAGPGWTTFGTTDANGMVSTQVPVAGLSKIQMREVNQSGFIPFDSNSNGDGTAEFYCASDVAGYDNREWITTPKAGATYYCVGFNAPTPKGNLHILKLECPRNGNVDVNDVYSEVNTESEIPQLSNESLGIFGCTLGDNYEFGVSPEHDGPISPLGSTTDGYLYTELEEGFHRVGETYQGNRVHSDDMIGYGCFNLNTPDYEDLQPLSTVSLKSIDISFNPHNVAISDKWETLCIAINPAPYCGDGKVNQEREQCDGEEGCDKDCTWDKDEATVVFQKIVCENETDLPNRSGTENAIDANTAQNYVNSHPGCKLVDGRQFQWRTKDGSKDEGDETIGAVEGRYTTEATVGGQTSATINIEETTNFAFREVLKEGYIPFDNPNGYGAEFYCNTDVLNYDNREFIDGMQKDQTYHCVAFNVPKPRPSAKVVLHKIVCDEEKHLPNRGKNGAPDITDKTAKKFVKNHSKHCRFEEDRTFQYAPINSNPGDNMLDPAGEPWTSITATDEDGMTMVTLPVDEINEYAFREVLKEGYVQFSYSEDTSNGIKRSAEIYCHKDGINYDNRDYVQGMHKNETYHCVAFNALKRVPKGDLHILKVECPDIIEDELMYAQTMNKKGPRRGENPFAEINREALGCSVADEYSFGYQAEGDEEITELPATYEGQTHAQLPEGPYMVGELDGENGWMAEENMIDFTCYGYKGPNPEVVDNEESSVGSMEAYDYEGFNPQYVYIHKKHPTYCIAINPKEPVCGNGYHEVGEECDDGDTQSGDGCSSRCTEENVEPVCEEFETGYADSVYFSLQGKRKDGSDVLPARSNPNDVLGTPNGIGNPASGFFALGFNGRVTVEFETLVFNKAGDDISIHEITNGRNSYPLETAEIEVSQDGSAWYTIGTANSSSAVSYFDIDDAAVALNRVQYVRVTDTSNPALHDATADGFDLDAVDAVYLCDESDNGGNNGGSSSTSSSDGKTTSVDRVVPKKENDKPKKDSSSSNNSSNGGNQEPKQQGLLETGGGEDEEEPTTEQNIANPDGLTLTPGSNAQVPLQLAATGGNPFLAALSNAIKIFANLLGKK